MKKLTLALACAALLASCASTPQSGETQGQAAAPAAWAEQDDGRTATADAETPPNAAALPDEQEYGPGDALTDNAEADGIATETLVIITTDDDDGTAITDDTRADDGDATSTANEQAANDSAAIASDAAQTGDGNIEEVALLIAESTTDEETTTDGAGTSEARESECEEMIAEADILQNAAAARNDDSTPPQLVEPTVFDAPNADNAAAQTDTVAAEDDSPQDAAQDTTAEAAAQNETATPARRDPPPTEQEDGANGTTEAFSSGAAISMENTGTPAPNADDRAPPPATDNAQNAANQPGNTNATVNQPTADTATQPSVQDTRQNSAQTATKQSAAENAMQSATAASAQDRTKPSGNGSAAATQSAEQDAPQRSAAYAPNADDALSAALIPLQSQPVTPSRSVTVKNNQYLDVAYPGSGWVYLGEAEENRDKKNEPLFSYFGRKPGTTDTTFTLRSRKPGETLLHFYKNDALTGQYIDDYLAVRVEDESAAAGQRATAPAYAQAVPPKPSRQTRQSYENAGVTEDVPAARDDGHQEEKTDARQAARAADAEQAQGAAAGGAPVSDRRGARTVIQTTESAPGGEAKSPAPAPSSGGTDAATAQRGADGTDLGNGGDLLEQAKRAYAARQYESALDSVRRYLADAGTRLDEALFLQGQILEADSSVKSVRSAIDSYEALVKNHPASALWSQANNRIIYLRRFYIDIR